MKTLFMLFFSAILLLPGCSTIPTDDIKVTAQADPKVKFAGYKTYSWLDTVGVLNDPEMRWKPVGFDLDSEITFLIDRALRNRNILESNNRTDLLVSYMIGINMAALKSKIDPKTNIKTLQNVPQGALLVVLIDARSGFVVWAARATAEIKGLAPEEAKKRLDYVITQMFKKLPK